MQVLRFATRTEIEAIFEENHELWGKPLSPQQYRDYWFSLFLTPWGASNFRYMALSEGEDGPLLSSLKLYRLQGRLFGRPVSVAGIGAVYSPRRLRGLGSASLLVSETLDYAQRKKASLALLFTDIGLPFYDRLGFMGLPDFAASGRLERTGARMHDPPGVSIREIESGDAAALADFHAAATAAGPFSIVRDAVYWDFLLTRRFRFWEMAPPEVGRPVSLAALRGAQIVSTGFAVAAAESLRVQEALCLPGEEEALRAVLDRIFEAGIRAGAPVWHGRPPASLARIDPRLAGERVPVTTGIPMLAPLGEAPDLSPLAADPACELLALDHV